MAYYNLFELQGSNRTDVAFTNRKENLSSFEEFYLRELGLQMRKDYPDSQHFWRDGAYCWYTDGTQSRIQSVYLLVNGVCVFSDFTINTDGKGKLFKVEFKY